MLVIAEAAERHQPGRADEAAVAEIIVHVLGLGRPVWGEHVFRAGADGVAMAVGVIEHERGRHAGNGQGFAVVGMGVAALDVEQARAPGIADPAGDRGQRALVVVVDDAAREDRMHVIAAEPAVLALDADEPARCELPVAAGLHAAEQAGVGVAEREAAKIVAAGERAADMAADIEAGPVEDRRGIGRRVVVMGAGAEIGAERRRGSAEHGESRGSEQNLFHGSGSPANRLQAPGDGAVDGGEIAGICLKCRDLPVHAGR
jgi:hypothetical protein